MAWWTKSTKRQWGRRQYRKEAGRRALRQEDKVEVELDAADLAEVHLEIGERLRDKFGPPPGREE